MHQIKTKGIWGQFPISRNQQYHVKKTHRLHSQRKADTIHSPFPFDRYIYERIASLADSETGEVGWFHRKIKKINRKKDWHYWRFLRESLALWKSNRSRSKSRNQSRGVLQSLQTESSKTKLNTIANRSTKEDTNYETSQTPFLFGFPPQPCNGSSPTHCKTSCKTLIQILLHNRKINSFFALHLFQSELLFFAWLQQSPTTKSKSNTMSVRMLIVSSSHSQSKMVGTM